MKHKWTKSALAELFQIKEFHQRNSEPYARSLVESIFFAPESLERHPKLGRMVPEYENENVREIFVHPYRVIYEIDLSREEIWILAVMNESRDLKKMNLPDKNE